MRSAYRRPCVLLQLLQRPWEFLLHLPTHRLHPRPQRTNVPGSVGKSLSTFPHTYIHTYTPNCVLIPVECLTSASLHVFSDIDECAAGSHTCSAFESCFNIQGGFRCLSFACPANFREAARGWELVMISCCNKKGLWSLAEHDASYSSIL